MSRTLESTFIASCGIPLSATALRRGYDSGVRPIKITETNSPSPYILICMMVKVPAVLIIINSYLIDFIAI
jgi:hypothetical protein